MVRSTIDDPGAGSISAQRGQRSQLELGEVRVHLLLVPSRSSRAALTELLRTLPMSRPVGGLEHDRARALEVPEQNALHRVGSLPRPAPRRQR